MLATAWAVSLSGAGGLDFGKELLKRRRMVRSSDLRRGSPLVRSVCHLELLSHLQPGLRLQIGHGARSLFTGR